MTRQALGALVAAALLAAGGAVPAGAQTACRQILITTTRTSSPIAVTPLDAIAFPVPLTPATTMVTRQITVCPPGAVPLVVTPPGVIVNGTPVFGTPVFGAPVFVSPLETPFLGTTVVDTPVVVPVAPARQPGPWATGQPSAPRRPAIAGTAPHDSVRDLATQPAQFDRTVVSVTGTATTVQRTTDASGAPVTTFRLEAGGTSVGVVAWGRAPITAGEAVRVSGPFYVSTPFADPAGSPWHNVIAADVLER